MAKSGKELVAKGQENEGTDVKPVTFNQLLNDWIGKNKKSLEGSFGSEAARFVRTVYNVCKFTPKLLECNFHSLTDCILQSLELSLYPGPVFQECAYVPRSIKGNLTACFEPMYKGIVKVATNAGLRDISTGIVYQADTFVFTSEKFLHVPMWDLPEEERGEMRGAWCKLKTVHGGKQVEVMNMKQIYAHRDRGAAGRKGEGPWFDPLFQEGMIRKTVLKKALKYVSKSPKLSLVIRLDDEAEVPELREENDPAKALPLSPPSEYGDEEGEQNG